MVVINCFVRLCKSSELHLRHGQAEVLSVQPKMLTQRTGISVEILQTVATLVWRSSSKHWALLPQHESRKSLTDSYCGRNFSHVSQSFTCAHVCNLRLPTRVFSPSVLYHVFYVILLYIRRNYKSCIVHQALGSINFSFPNQEICLAPDMNFILIIYWYFDSSSGLILLSTNYFSLSLVVLEFPQVILIGFMVIQPKENLQFLSLDPFAFMCLYNWNPTRSHVSIIAAWYTE